MSRENGQMLTCNRCGTWVFLKCTGEGETDGGFTRWNNFEPAPGWNVASYIGDLCPECYKAFQDMFENFAGKRLFTKEDSHERD